MVVVKQLKDKSGTNFQPNCPDAVGYIDTSNKTSMNWEQTHTATEDGWVEMIVSTEKNTGAINGRLLIDSVDVGGVLLHPSNRFGRVLLHRSHQKEPDLQGNRRSGRKGTLLHQKAICNKLDIHSATISHKGGVAE